MGIICPKLLLMNDILRALFKFWLLPTSWLTSTEFLFAAVRPFSRDGHVQCVALPVQSALLVE
jgi:hypothetical protein